MESLLFNILDRVDSTNNYAMGKVHEGLAIHGQAWFARRQEQGKGQRGKTWQSSPDQNILMSVAIRPPKGYDPARFHFHALIALTIVEFLETHSGVSLMIKWPNDIYIGDRKAGGILIENSLQGSDWKWAVVGIGINVNQELFPDSISNAISLCMVSEIRMDPLALARGLHAELLKAVDAAGDFDHMHQLISGYNEKLYKKGKTIRLKAGNRIFETTLKGVDEFGRLISTDHFETPYMHGQVEWLLQH